MIPLPQIQSAERYNDLERALKILKPGSPEHTQAWRELEAIKNTNGGQVPAEKE